MYKTLKRYFSLFLGIAKVSYIADMEYRLNFSSRIIMDLIWYLGQIFTFEVLYLHTPQIGGWTIGHMRVFLGVVFLVDAAYMFFFEQNLSNISELSSKGELDLLLTKPVNSQFFVSCRRIHSASIGNGLMASAWLGWALWSYGPLPLAHYITGLILIPSSVMIMYAFRMFFAASSLIFVNLESLQYLWYSIYRFGIRPDAFYPRWLRLLLLTLIPVGAIASLPARLFLEGTNLYLAIWSLTLSGILTYSSHIYWNFCLRRYSSASS